VLHTQTKKKQETMSGAHFLGLDMVTPIMNASGVKCTTYDELYALYTNPNIGGIVTKSSTLSVRSGNPKPRYYSLPNLSINSMGLPNHGVEYYLDCVKRLKNASTIPDKPVLISVAGLSLDENLKIFNLISKFAHDTNDNLTGVGVEFNLSCPNVVGKPQTCYDFDMMDEALRKIFEIDLPMNIGVKLSPYFDPIHFQCASDVLLRYPKLSFVTCINSIGNGLVIDPISETTVIVPKNGLGGLGGSIVKPTALANVNTFRRLLPSSVNIIGCGGIMRGVDVFEHVLCGAEFVQLGTILHENGVSDVERIMKELDSIMTIKAYSSLIDFRAKLRTAAVVDYHPSNDPCLILSG
jgi:dihydroorotate dehydrogenase (fumarate)